jgi:DNA-directed RNA polymerase specialized sigma24 family protein
MPRSNRSPRAQLRTLAVDEYIALHDQRATLDAIVRAHRHEMVTAAGQHLGDQSMDDEDAVQDVCLAVLEGELSIPEDAELALEVLLRAIAARCGKQDR